MPPPEQFSGGTGAGPGPGLGPSTAFGSSGSDAMHAPDAMPAPGQLHIKGKLTWKTWQMVVAIVVALLVGMGLNYHSVGASSSSGKPAYTPPPPGGATTTTAPASGKSTGSTTTVAGGSTTTTAAGGSTTTTTSSSTSSTAAASAGRSPSRSDAAPGKLDQPVLHDDCRRLEHRLGLQVYARSSLGTVVRGVRDARRLVTRRHARHQRDGTIGSIGDRPVHARSTDLGGASPGLLHMGGEGHGLLGHARRAKPACGWELPRQAGFARRTTDTSSFVRE